jgi:hypothetical protein
MSDDFDTYHWYYSVPANLSFVSDDRLVEIQREAYIMWEMSKV